MWQQKEAVEFLCNKVLPKVTDLSLAARMGHQNATAGGVDECEVGQQQEIHNKLASVVNCLSLW